MIVYSFVHSHTHKYVNSLSKGIIISCESTTTSLLLQSPQIWLQILKKLSCSLHWGGFQWVVYCIALPLPWATAYCQPICAATNTFAPTINLLSESFTNLPIKACNRF